MNRDDIGTVDFTGSSPPESTTKPKAPTKIVQNSPLLSLPLEVFQSITFHMDASTFFISLLTCKYIYKAAKSKVNLLRHLYSIPGLRLGLEYVSQSGLLSQFQKRAAGSGCAAGVLADVTIFSQTSRTSLSSAAFSPANPYQLGSHAYLATVHDDVIVLVHDIGKTHAPLKAELHIRPEDGNHSRIEIFRLAFCSGSRDLAVLYRHIPCRDESAVMGSFIDHKHPGVTLYKLVIFRHVHKKTRGYFYDSHLQETRAIPMSDTEVPVGLALASNGHACIAWKVHGLNYKTDVTLIGRDEKMMKTCSHDDNPRILRIQDPSGLPPYMHKDRQIFGMQFVEHDQKLILFEPGNPVHSWYTTACSPAREECDLIRSNTAIVQLDYDETPSAATVGMPFHGAHFDNITVDWQAAPLCKTSYLALGIDSRIAQSPYAYIMKAERHNASLGCNHAIKLDEGRKLLSWSAVALLAGWRLGDSSLGTVVAISPKGTRLAAATWSRVLVWSFNPRLLHQEELQHYFPVRDFNIRKGVGRLRPTLLSSEGVVYSVHFADETRLCAATDRGLVRWDMGHLSQGKRQDLSLRSQVAVAVPTRSTAYYVEALGDGQCRSVSAGNRSGN